MAAAFTVIIGDEGARQALVDLLGALKAKDRGPIAAGFKRAGAVFLGFIRARFLLFSSGRGSWPPLSAYTIAKRLGKVAPARLRRALQATGGKTRGEQIAFYIAAGKVPILRDTGHLFNSLSIGGPGNIFQMTSAGLEVGTAVKYAEKHQTGVPPRLPKREFLVDPDEPTDAKMGDFLAEGILVVIHQGTPEGRRAARVLGLRAYFR